LEGIREVIRGNTFDVASDAGFRTNPEEERGHILYLQYALFGQLCNKRNKIFLGGMGSLENGDPLLEPGVQLVT